MKVRNGFVSNSSSSSFLVLLNDSNRHLAKYDYEITEREQFIVANTESKRTKDQDKERESELIKEGYMFEEFKKMYGDVKMKVFSRKKALPKTNEIGLDLDTSICFGNDLLKYLEILSSGVSNTTFYRGLMTEIKQVVEEHGLNNLLFFREYGNVELPKELQKLKFQAIWSRDVA